MAGKMAEGPVIAIGETSRQGKVLYPRHVPIPFRQLAHGPCAGLHDFRRPGPVQAYEWI